MSLDFLDRGKDRKGGVGYTDRLPSTRTLTKDPICKLGMCPDLGSKPSPLVYGTMLQPTEPPGQNWLFLIKMFNMHIIL